MAYYNGIGIDTIESITSGKIIGTASVASHYDISGNANAISQTTRTMQCKYDSELGTWSWDGEAQAVDLAVSGATWVYPTTVTLSNGVLKLGQNADGTLKEETLYGLAAFSRTPMTLEQARIALWYASLDPVQRQITYVTASVENAVDWLENIYVGAGTSTAMDNIYTALITAWPALGA